MERARSSYSFSEMDDAKPSKGSNLPLYFAALVLGLQFFVVLFHNERSFSGSETYYVGKAQYFSENHTFPKAGRREHHIAAGNLYGTTDWRPPGYAVLLTGIGAGALDDPRLLRVRVLVVQFALVAAAVLLMLHLLCRDVSNSRLRWGAAVVLSLSPWPFEFAAEIVPDTIAAVLVAGATLLMWRWVAGAGGTPTFFWAGLLASLPLLLRPELLPFAPLLALSTFAVGRRFRIRDAMAAALAFALVLGIQVAYRNRFIGQPQLYGAFRIPTAGVIDWTRTWLGTEKEAFDFVAAASESRPAVAPSRAWGGAAERKIIEEALARAAKDGYGKKTDAAFASVAEKRKKERPVLVAFIRATNAIQVWIHAGTGFELERVLAGVPTSLRRPARIALIVFRISILVLAFLGAARALRRWRGGESGPADRMTLLMCLWAVAATILVAIVLDWRMHRLVLSAWLPVLWCAAAAFRRVDVEADVERS